MTAQGRILIISSDEDVSGPLSFYLGGADFDVSVAATPQDGLLEAARQRPDLILLAATLGDVDGVMVFRQLRRAPLTAHIPIMFMAGYLDAARRNQLLAEGADDVIAVPFDVEILTLRVRNAIRRTRREGLTEPRTGLPTGPLLAEQLEALHDQPEKCRLDVHIADFDAFRARYDFLAGNEVLRYAAGAICEIVDDVVSGGFVGHQGEANFIIIADRDRARTLKERLQAQLDEGLQQFYTFMEREQGCVLVEDGQGGMIERPLMHLQIMDEESE